MYITKGLKEYLSSLFPNKNKGIFYENINNNCYILVKTHKEKNYISWDSSFKKCIINSGVNFYDIRFSIILNPKDNFNPFDYSLDYSLCAVCGKAPSEWAIATNDASLNLLTEIKECFQNSCYIPLFDEQTDLYDWTKNIVCTIYGKDKLLIDELYFMYDLADYCKKNEEKLYWNNCINQATHHDFIT